MENQQQFDEMKHVLKNAIQRVNYIPNTFQIFAWEAGLGKSKWANQYIGEAYDNINSPSTFLIVKKFKSDVENTVKELKENSIITQIYGEDAIVGITSDNWGYWRENMQKLNACQVLVITHQRYITLCEEELKPPFAGRNTLIIDEKVEFPTYEFSKHRYDNIRQVMSHNLQKQFDVLNTPLLDLLEEYEHGTRNQIKVAYLEFDTSLIKEFLKVIDANRESITGKVENLIDYINELMFFYNNLSIFNGKKFFARNPNHKLRMLENNIILDASANIDSVYSGEKYKIIESRRIVNYEHSTLSIEYRNSSRYAVKKQANYMKDAARFAQNLKKFNKKCLYICHKSEATSLKKEIESSGIEESAIHLPKEQREIDNCIVAINWFGNIIGQNLYSDFNMCYIIGTNNLPYPVYLLQYIIYNDIDDFSKWDLTINKGKFEERSLEKLRQGFIAADFYQALKRIQRNKNPKGHYILVNKDEEIGELVARQFNNIQQIKGERKLPDEENTVQPDTLNDKLIKYLKALEKGKYKKSDIASAIGTTTKNISRLWKSETIQYYEKNGYIQIGHHDLTIFQGID